MNQNCQIKIPHVGEGVHTVQVVKILKGIGDWVDEDGDLAEIETDKSTFEIPSSVSGYIQSIHCQEGETVNVGTLLLEINQSQNSDSSAAFQQKRRIDNNKTPANRDVKKHDEHTLPKSQLALIHNLKTSSDTIIQASVERCLEYTNIQEIRAHFRSRDPKSTPSMLSIVVHACANAMTKFDKFRARLSADLTYRISEDCHLGIAVSTLEDQISVPVIAVSADTSMEDIGAKIATAVSSPAMETSYHSVSISDMSVFDIRSAVPVVVYPAVATLFIGAPYWSFNKKGVKSRMMNLVLSFDHRIINGAYAADFLSELEEEICRVKRKLMG